jgi:hypothetical protein
MMIYATLFFKPVMLLYLVMNTIMVMVYAMTCNLL